MERDAVIIIGGGIGGLFCGAILAREGFRVTLFEQHRVAGGGLHEFCRDGVSFETGMHVAGAFHPGAALHRLCTYLGIMDRLSLLPADEECFEQFDVEGKQYRFPRGASRLVEALAAEFPTERENIRRHVEAMYALCDEDRLYDLRLPTPIQHAPRFARSVGEFIDASTSNERLRSVLAFRNPLYAGDRYKTPAYIHAFVSKLYIEGSTRFVGGSRQLADALVDVMTRAGGELRVARGIARVEIRDKAIDHVVSVDGERHRAAWYISSIDPRSLFDLLDRDKLQRSYCQRIDAIPSTYSAFSLFLVFKPGAFPFFNHARFYMERHEDAWRQADRGDKEWPRGLMCITPPETTSDRFARKMIVTCIMHFDDVRQWEHTTTGQRGETYEAFKREREERVITRLERVFPGIRSCIKSAYSASPLTIRDYCKRKEGALYGFAREHDHPERSHLSTRTKLSNLLFTGQNVHLHGILGVPVTAVETCSALVGMEYLLNKINARVV
ncbi:MAG: FAD-dependent oxidoreductase [Odoribacteraceae bacterium]|jgi:all-trans-retinol 13,14-reductase|nr:FAD-dependent oxidoreductase [Odoribacteraceae bacterium]